MFEFIGKNIIGRYGDKRSKEAPASKSPPLFTFDYDDVDSYQYPNLYDEADDMLQASMLMYR